MNKKGKLLAAALVLTLSLSGCSGLLPEQEEDLAPPLIEPAAVSYETVKVEKGPIQRMLKGTATLKSYNEKNYFFQQKDGVFKEVYVSSGQQVKKGDLLAEVDSGTLDQQIKQLEITKKKQQLQLSEYKAQLSEASTTRDIRSLKLQINLLNLDAESTNLEYDTLVGQRNATKLVAEADGVVSYVNGAFSAGDVVPAYQVLVTVADPSKLQLFYQASNAKEAKRGMAVTYTYEGQELKGEVLQTPYDLPADGDELYKDSLLMSCENLPAGLKWGDTLPFTILVAQAESTLVIPRTALTEYSGKYYVDVLDGESKYTVEVTIGIIGAQDVEILGGLTEGMEVIIK